MLAPDALHVWQIDVSAAPPEARALLGPDERARADRFRRPADRVRFTASHAALRRILASYLPPSFSPAALRFETAAQGKPALVLPGGSAPLRFSLAHSGDLALVAVAWGREVGVDVEAERPLSDVLRLADRMAAAAERDVLRVLQEPERSRAFFRLWVAKEAVLKARGTGLHADPRQVVLSGLDRSAVALEAAGDHEGTWALASFDVPEGYCAAVAVAGHMPSITPFRWPPSGSP